MQNISSISTFLLFTTIILSVVTAGKGPISPKRPALLAQLGALQYPVPSTQCPSTVHTPKPQVDKVKTARPESTLFTLLSPCARSPRKSQLSDFLKSPMFCVDRLPSKPAQSPSTQHRQDSPVASLCPIFVKPNPAVISQENGR